LRYPIIRDNDPEKCKARTRNALSEPGRHAEAIESYERAVAIRPYYASTQKNQEIALKLKGEKPFNAGAFTAETRRM
jgi:tetratricopeptide (TPR) repeat protein